MTGVLARRSAVVGGLLVALVVAIAVLAPWIAGDPGARDIDHGLTALGAPLPPLSPHALLGTDDLGRDVWARLAAGATTSLAIAALAALGSLAVGTLVGLGAGLGGPRVDGAIMRAIDLVLAFPVLLLAILLAALLRETALADSIAPVVLTLAVVGASGTARVVRTQARALARGEMVAAAHALGASRWRIARRHVLPNVAGIAITMAALAFAQNLIIEATLSYLGLGPPAPAATWGRMLHEGRPYYRSAPWLIIAPGIAILVAVIGFNLVAEAWRDRVERR